MASNKTPQRTTPLLQTYTVTECMQILHLSRVSVLRFIESGQLKAAKVCGKWLITEDTIQELLRATNTN